MKLSLAWLRRYTPLTAPVSEIEEALSLIGFEVEGVEAVGLAELPFVVVGEVRAIAQHPQADRLSYCDVAVAPGEAPLAKIVCGAKNFKVGDRVPVALPGAVLPGDRKIERTLLRGVPSEGMMCSGAELGLGSDHSGLLILTDRPEIGTPIAEALGGPDTIFDVEVTPNRPDCLSHLGMARELAAYFGLPLEYPEAGRAVATATAAPVWQGVTVEAPTACPQYRGYQIAGVTIAPSPGWLRRAIESIGLRPINNVVDVTNFVLHELGQPLHAFDAAKIGGQRLVVRTAAPGETITTLDGKQRALSPEMLVIADATRPLVVAGVMGSVDAEVDATTRDLVLESAYFEPVGIRSTSRRLGLSTDSSYRFERGVDPAGQEFAALRAIDLILEVAGGQLVGSPIVVGQPNPVEEEIELRADYVNRTLGFDLPEAEMVRVLDALELTTTEAPESELGSGTVWRVTVPSFRVDLEAPIDLVEEILRIHGAHKIPPAPVLAPTLVQTDDPRATYLRQAGLMLAGAGFVECVHYTLRGADEVADFSSAAEAELLALANPFTTEMGTLRPSLVPGLLDAVKLNLARSTGPERLFETGRVYHVLPGGALQELVSVGAVLVRHPVPERWQPAPEASLYEATDLVRRLLQGLPAGPVRWQPQLLPGWQENHAATAGDLATQGWRARAGLVSLPLLQRRWGLKAVVVAATVDFLPDFLVRPVARPRFVAPPSHPAALRDLALLVDEVMLAGDAAAMVATASQGVAKGFAVEEVLPFDVYRGTGLPPGKKSLGFRLRFRAPDRTLTDDEVNRAFAEVQKRVAATGQVTVRG